MRRWPIMLAFGLLALLGLWLWSRNGLAVFVDAAIAFCT